VNGTSYPLFRRGYHEGRVTFVEGMRVSEGLKRYPLFEVAHLTT
jgi:hypothetical protein